MVVLAAVIPICAETPESMTAILAPAPAIDLDALVHPAGFRMHAGRFDPTQGPGVAEVGGVLALQHGAGVNAFRLDDDRAPGFIDTYLMPRLNGQLNQVVAPMHLGTSTELVDYVLYDSLMQVTRIHAERGVRRALKSFVLESTPLGRLNKSIRSSVGGGKKRGNSAGVKFGVGVSHGLPKLEMRYRSGAAHIRLNLDAVGAAGIEFSHEQALRTRVWVGYDIDEGDVNLACRFGF